VIDHHANRQLAFLHLAYLLTNLMHLHFPLPGLVLRRLSPLGGLVGLALGLLGLALCPVGLALGLLGLVLGLDGLLVGLLGLLVGLSCVVLCHLRLVLNLTRLLLRLPGQTLRLLSVLTSALRFLPRLIDTKPHHVEVTDAFLGTFALHIGGCFLCHVSSLQKVVDWDVLA
jgi:hypothetical protein